MALRLQHSQRRTALVAAELNRYDIEIAALSETRLPESGQLVEVGSGFTFFWKGKGEKEKREAGVGFAISTALANKLEELPVGISERLMTLRLHLGKGRYVTILSVYAPTLTSNEETYYTFIPFWQTHFATSQRLIRYYFWEILMLE